MSNQVAVKLQLRDRFVACIRVLAKQRDKRQGITSTSRGPECDWAVFEREEMLAEVNRIRASFGFVPTTLGAIYSAELLASGHVDYAEKFALYCAVIAMRELP